jgi:antirestriction protein ArdC
MAKYHGRKSGEKTEPLAAPKQWSELLQSVIDQPGEISRAFRMFHNYSFGNILLAWAQIAERELPLGPIATYRGWQMKGRQVRKGEKSLILCQPSSFKKEDAKTGEMVTVPFFRYRPGWFALAQTDGDVTSMPELPDWDYKRALATLAITEAPFEQPSDPKLDPTHFTLTPMSGNTMGYFRRSTRTIHISPLDRTPLHTALHEIAHAELHGDKEGAQTERATKELEAELTAMLVADALGFDFANQSRGYVQDWFKGRDIAEVLTDERAKKLIRCADRILKAGQPVKAQEEESEVAA